jgi:hypothetical protein
MQELILIGALSASILIVGEGFKILKSIRDKI